MKPPVPTPLVGTSVRLEPLSSSHEADLSRAANEDPATFEYMSSSPLAIGMDRYIAETRAAVERGHFVAFAVISCDADCAVGTTRFGDIDVANQRLEIGWTWIAPHARGTSINTEMKLLMLAHAFDELGCQRVALKTDARNVRSQSAIERLGAVREGVLRNHMTMPDGFVRDTVYYSIISAEWPTVSELLRARLAAIQRG